MKTIIFFIIFLLIIFGYGGEAQVTFKPFSLKFNNLYYAFGWLFLIAGISCMYVSGHKKGYEKGYEKATNDAIKIIKSAIPGNTNPKPDVNTIGFPTTNN